MSDKKMTVEQALAGLLSAYEDICHCAVPPHDETEVLPGAGQCKAGGLDRGGGAGIERVKCYPRPLRKRERPEPPVGLDGVDDRVGIP